jgi:hypothetical protein
MAKFAAGFLFIIPPIFVVKAVVDEKVFAGILVKLAMIIAAAGSFAMGGWMVASGAMDMYVDYQLAPVTYQPTELPPFAQNEFVNPLTPEEEALAACNVSLDYYKTLLDANLTFTHERNNDLEQCQNTLIEWALTCEVP